MRALEKKYGVRYSELFRLSYFDPIRMHVIDPMHNLLLGTAKHMFKTWLTKECISKNDLLKIDKLQHMIKVSADIGRVARNISKAYKNMKADEWKNFTIVYSLFCLKDILKRNEYEHWTLFVNACRIICKRSITAHEINYAHDLLQRFCQEFEDIYGKEFCTPNMHLHLHLKRCMMDFGPVYSFWCFSFERFNGVLGS